MAKKTDELVGFTTDYYHRCVICKRELDPAFVDTHVTCECSALIMPVRLQPKQDQFLNWVLATGPDVPTKLLFGGARAAGKSRGLRDITLIVMSECAATYNGIPAYLMRRNWTQCQETLLEKFRIERGLLADWYNGQEKQYTFPAVMGEPRIAFKYADSPDDVERLERGPECFFLGLDQGEQFSELTLQRLASPNRWPGSLPNAPKMGIFFNWGGPGSAYLRRVAITKQFEHNETPGDFAFIQAFGHDNIFWFLNQGIEIYGQPLNWDLFYSLSGEIPEPSDGKYTNKWRDSLPNDNRFKIYVTQTSEGRKHWAKPDAIRMGDLFGRYDSFEGQAFQGVWSRDRAVIR